MRSPGCVEELERGGKRIEVPQLEPRSRSRPTMMVHEHDLHPRESGLLEEPATRTEVGAILEDLPRGLELLPRDAFIQQRKVRTVQRRPLRVSANARARGQKEARTADKSEG